MSRAQVVVSPHADDAVWSLGGRIAAWRAAGALVTVVTVFDGAGDTACESQQPADWRAIAEPATRHAEDVAALAELDVVGMSVGWPEAALRTDDDRTFRYPARLRVFGPPHERDLALPRSLADVLAGLCDSHAVLHGPLAAGRHVDHVLVRRAIDLLADAGREVRYYEDFPYRLRPADHAGLVATFESVETARWLRAARRYVSQVSTMFGAEDRFEDAIVVRARTHGRSAGLPYADRVWARKTHGEMTPENA
jgi:LmbE family N-acetylglucosaminyl deacetylase